MCKPYLAALRSYVHPLALIPLASGVLPILMFPASSYVHGGRVSEARLLILGAMMTATIFMWAVGITYHVKHQTTQVPCALIPRFRETHAVIAGYLAACVLLLHSIVLCICGASLLGTLAILTAAFAVMAWATAILPALIVLVTLSLVPVYGGNGFVENMVAILRGEANIAGVALLAAAAIAVHHWGRWFLRSEEHDCDTRLRPPRFAMTQEEPHTKVLLQIGVAEGFERLAGYIGDGRRARLRHWQLGNSSYAVWLEALIMAPMTILPLGVFRLAETKNADFLPFLGLLSPMLFPACTWLLTQPIRRATKALNRGCALGYESLRPCSKPQFIRELGLAAARDALQSWGTMLLVSLIIVALLTPELLSIIGILVLILWTGTLVLSLGIATLASVWSPGSAFFAGSMTVLLVAGAGRRPSR